MMKLIIAVILSTLTLQVNAQSSEEIALIIGGVEKIDGGGVTNEILDVEVYAPFNQDLLDSFLPVPNLKQHISFVKAIYREGEDGQGEVLACGLTNPANDNMECFKLTLVDGELVWQEGFSGNTINTKYCSLIHQVKTETHPRTYCYESMARKGKAWFWYSGLQSWFSESVIENDISSQYCSVKINVDGTEEPVILHLGGESYPNEFTEYPQEYPVAVCPDSAVLHPWCNGTDERVKIVEKELAVGYEYNQAIGPATCTTFPDDSGYQVVIIVPSGTLIDAVKIFRVDECHIRNGAGSDPDLCTWQKRKALTPNDDIFIKLGELIEFDSKPTMFGGFVHNESNTAVDYVIQYNLNTNTWTSIKEMSKTRVRHGVVKVPASFLMKA